MSSILTTMPIVESSQKAYAGGRVRRFTLASLGVVCVGIGAVGAFVPGLPTTIFLIIASWLFTKSCPWLERRLIRNRLFGPYLVYLDGNAPIPRRAKITAIGLMWVSVTMSVLVLRETMAGAWLPLGICALAVIGTLVIIRYGKRFESQPALAASEGAGANVKTAA